jgi:hypothetical protein
MICATSGHQLANAQRILSGCQQIVKQHVTHVALAAVYHQHFQQTLVQQLELQELQEQQLDALTQIHYVTSGHQLVNAQRIHNGCQ